jgi:hypothetical protein
MPFQSNFLITNPTSLSDTEARTLQEARNADDYPYTRIIFSGAGGDIELAPGEWAAFDKTKSHQATDLSLDAYHRDLAVIQSDDATAGNCINYLLGLFHV